jgi:hypothetical protein
MNPVTECGDELDQPAEFDGLTNDEKRQVLAWIDAYIEPSGGRIGYTSYWLKHRMEGITDLYVTSGAFKGAMLAAGYQPVAKDAVNWWFNCRWKPICEAITKRGRPCRRHSMSGKSLCPTHYYIKGK